MKSATVASLEALVDRFTRERTALDAELAQTHRRETFDAYRETCRVLVLAKVDLLDAQEARP